MERHEVSRGTARHALRLLTDQGAASIRRGARAVVLAVPQQPEQALDELHSFSGWARALGRVPSGRVISLTRREATIDDAAQLAVGEGSPVWDLVRVRRLDDRPVMIERSTYPHDVGTIVAGLSLEEDSISDRLAEHGLPLIRARHTIDARAAEAFDAALLEVPVGTALLCVRRLSTGEGGRVLEWGDDRYLGDSVAFVVENVARTPTVRRTAPR